MCLVMAQREKLPFIFARVFKIKQIEVYNSFYTKYNKIGLNLTLALFTGILIFILSLILCFRDFIIIDSYCTRQQNRCFSMKTNHKFTSFGQHKPVRGTNTPFNRTHNKQNNKSLTQESVPHQQPFLSTTSFSKDYVHCYQNVANDVTTSEVFVSVGHQPKDCENNQIQVRASNKYILGNSNNREQFTNSRENPSDIFAKRSVRILIDLKQGMMESKYSKISRRKEQFLKKSIISNNQMTNNDSIMEKIAKRIENAHSQQKLIDKYRQLLQVKEKPFNMVNKLYQIDLLTAKQAIISPKQLFKPTSTKLTFKKKTSNIEPKNNQISQQSNNDKTDKSVTLSNFHPTRKPYSHQRYKEARPLRQMRSKNTKFIQQTSNNLTIGSPVRSNEFKFNQNTQKKGSLKSLNIQSPTKKQKLTAIALPKKISSAAFIIYEVFQDKNKPNFRKMQFQSTKKQQINGRIHASFNIKSASQIASLTKIMTCIVIIQLCEKLTINPQQEKYKIGVNESTIRGTSAEIQAGEIYTIHQLLHGLMLPSGNDASLALARWGGNVLLLTDGEGQKRRVQQKMEKTWIDQRWLANNKFLCYREDKLKYRRCYNRFLAEMNKKARVLGLDRTNYVNSHGLSNPHNKSCCLDLAILCQYAMQNAYFRIIVGCKQYSGLIEKCVQVDNPKEKKRGSAGLKIDEDPEQMNLLQDAQDEAEFNDDSQDWEQTDADSLVPGTKKGNETSREEKLISYVEKQIKWVNTHRLLHKKEYYLGIKTGVTATAGACLASFVSIQGRSFIIIVLNSKKLSLRFTDTELLRRWLVKKENLAKSVATMDCGCELNANY